MPIRGTVHTGRITAQTGSTPHTGDTVSARDTTTTGGTVYPGRSIIKTSIVHTEGTAHIGSSMPAGEMAARTGRTLEAETDFMVCV